MAIRSTTPMKHGGDTMPCPTCGFPVRIVYRDGKYADHYMPVLDQSFHQTLAPADRKTLKRLRELRKGKKTVALVGMAPTSCSLAPYKDSTAEIWGLNEAHSFDWMQSWDRWFQLHKQRDFKRDLDGHRAAERGFVKGHYEWLKQKHRKPIYMQFVYPEIPDSIEYPLREINERFFGGIRKGNERIKYETSTFAFMIAMALYEGFERIEIFGFEMHGGDEYVPQRACAEFWIGMALGMGVEIYLPPTSQLVWGPIYGFQGSGSGNVIDDTD